MTLRCSQALARLRWSDEVVSGDVDEAIRLMMMSKVMMIAVMVEIVEEVVVFDYYHPPISSAVTAARDLPNPALPPPQVSIHEEQDTQQRVDPTVGIFQIIRDAAILRSPFIPQLKYRQPVTFRSVAASRPSCALPTYSPASWPGATGRMTSTRVWRSIRS